MGSRSKIFREQGEAMSTSLDQTNLEAIWGLLTSATIPQLRNAIRMQRKQGGPLIADFDGDPGPIVIRKPLPAEVKKAYGDAKNWLEERLKEWTPSHCVVFLKGKYTLTDSLEKNLAAINAFCRDWPIDIGALRTAVGKETYEDAAFFRVYYDGENGVLRKRRVSFRFADESTFFYVSNQNGRQKKMLQARDSFRGNYSSDPKIAHLQRIWLEEDRKEERPKKGGRR